MAALERAKAEADYNESRVLLDVAQNERNAAKLDEKSADSRAKAAKASADMTRVKEAEAETRTARAAREAADKRHEYVAAYRKWLHQHLRYTQHNAFWKEAQYELEQAKIASANNIQPQGFALQQYTDQEAQRARTVSAARDRARREREAALAARTRWRAVQNSADKQLGRPSSHPDPLAPDEAGRDRAAADGEGGNPP
jgi:hypothetical protein